MIVKCICNQISKKDRKWFLQTKQSISLPFSVGKSYQIEIFFQMKSGYIHHPARVLYFGDSGWDLLEFDTDRDLMNFFNLVFEPIID